LLIIIEGVDRTGKTSLAKRIADKIDAVVVHAGPPTKHPIEEYQTALDGYSPIAGTHLVLDRWHVGEYVWPRIFGRETTFNRAVQKHTAMYMRSRGAYIVWADRRNLEGLKRDLVENNEPLQPKDLLTAQSLFTRAFADVGAHGVWDYEIHGDSEVNGIIAAAEDYEQQVFRVWWEVGQGWVGNERPKALLVGDELGPLAKNTNPPDDIPFAPYAATSGRYLIDSLHKWRDVALINSLQGRYQAPRDLQDAWSVFGRPNVVALGEKASERLTNYEVPHRTVPHPQYWRRFRYNDREEYTRLIEEAAGLD